MEEQVSRYTLENAGSGGGNQRMLRNRSGELHGHPEVSLPTSISQERWFLFGLFGLVFHLVVFNSDITLR